MTEQHCEQAHEEYAGPAEVLVDGGPIVVEVTLRGMFQPIDGRYHWYGRLAAHPDVDRYGRSGASVVLRTPRDRPRVGSPTWTRGAATASPAPAGHRSRRSETDPPPPAATRKVPDARPRRYPGLYPGVSPRR